MKIKSFCQVLTIYESLLEFFITTGYGETEQLTPHEALPLFIESYNEILDLHKYWKERGLICNESAGNSAVTPL